MKLANSPRASDLAAEKAFRQAADVAKTAALPREEAKRALPVAVLSRHESAGQSAVVNRSGNPSRSTGGDAYDLPIFVGEKAEVQAALGEVQQPTLHSNEQRPRGGSSRQRAQLPGKERHDRSLKPRSTSATFI